MKHLITLILFLTIPLLVNSQNLSQQDSSCIVPCFTLKNALIVKAEYNFLNEQIKITRDSIDNLILIRDDLEFVILLQDEVISLQKDNIQTLDTIIKHKNKEILLYKKDLKKQKFLKRVAQATSVAAIILGIYILI